MAHPRQPEDPAVTRAARMAGLGHQPASPPVAAELATAARDDEDARVRAAALGALARTGADELFVAWQRAVTDGDASVRRRTADLAPAVAAHHDPHVVAGATMTLLDDADVTVIAAAAWALGELGAAAIGAGAVGPLGAITTGHDDPLAREAAVAALGALADPAGLPAILTACTDKPTVRRRAVLALAPYEGPEVEKALQHALTDRDWQTRQAAEDLTRHD